MGYNTATGSTDIDSSASSNSSPKTTPASNPIIGNDTAVAAAGNSTTNTNNSNSTATDTTAADTIAAAAEQEDVEQIGAGAGSLDSSSSSTAQTACTFESSFDGQAWHAVPRWLLFAPGALSNAKHILKVRAADAAGNVSPVLKYSFTVDNSSPDTVLIAAPAAAAAVTTAHFTLADTVNVTAGLGGFEWRFDSASVTAKHPAWRSLHEPALTLTDLAEGQHCVDLRAVTYTAGNRRDTVPIRHAWTVDTTAPDTNIVVYPAVVTHLRSAIFVAKASEPGARFQYSLNSTVSTNSDSSSSSDGTQWIEADDDTGVLHLYDLAEGKSHCCTLVLVQLCILWSHHMLGYRSNAVYGKL
jgi:large repetitive protein